MKNYRRLLSYLKPYWKLFALSVVCMLGMGAMTGASAMIVKNVLDDVFIGKKADMLRLIPLAVIAIYFVKGIFQYLQAYYMTYIGQSVVRDIRDQLYAHIQRQSLSFFANNPTGTLMSRITYDVNQVNQAVTEAFASLMRDTLSIISLIGVVFYRDWRLASIAMLVYPFAVYPLARIGKKVKKVGKKSQVAMGYITSFLHETIAGARIVKAFGMEKYESDRFAAANGQFFKLLMKTRRAKASTVPIMEFLGSIGVAAIIWYGGFKVIAGQMTPGDFFSFLAALMLLYQPVKKLSNTNIIIQEAMAAAERIFDLLDRKPDIGDRAGAGELPAVSRGVEFRGVTFAYGEEKVIDDLSLTVRRGERIALVGSSGAGKTTFVNLIPRFYDVTGGVIAIDGHDIREVTVRSLRAQIAIVTQETVLFNDTVRNNIAYGHKEIDEAAVLAAAQAAFAHDFILQLPEGYDTVIGEQGVRLSGGQRQRLSIARALLKNAPILILDEATSALDTESEKLVQQALDNLMKDRTSFVIAHRLSTIRSADRILVLSRGRIAEEGTHDELVARGGIYSTLWEKQFAHE